MHLPHFSLIPFEVMGVNEVSKSFFIVSTAETQMSHFAALILVYAVCEYFLFGIIRINASSVFSLVRTLSFEAATPLPFRGCNSTDPSATQFK